MGRITATGRLTLGALFAAAFLAGCTKAPDMSAIAQERARPLQRYDVNQAVASNGSVVVVGTQSGVVLVSRDLGANWERLPLGRTSLIDIAVCADRSFVAVDHYHRVWFAGPEGRDWQSVALDKPRIPLAVACSPDGGWWVAGTRAMIAGSRDQGKTWQLTDLGEDTQITTLQFIDDSHAVALGEFGFHLRSADGGATWTRGADLPGEFYPYAALFGSTEEGWASGIAGQMLHTTDAGQTWQKQRNETNVSLNRLFMHEGVPFAVGNGGVVARLDGDVWRNVPYPDPLPMFLAGGASVAGQQAIVFGGPGGLLRSISTAHNN